MQTHTNAYIIIILSTLCLFLACCSKSDPSKVSSSDAIVSTGTDESTYSIVLNLILKWDKKYPNMEDLSGVEEWNDLSSDIMEYPDIVPALVRIIRDEELSFRIRALGFDLIGRLGPKASNTIPILLQFVKDRQKGRKGLHFNAIAALGKMGPSAREAAPAISSFLEDPDPNTRSFCISALGDIMIEDGKKIIPFLREGARDCSFIVRANSYYALAKIRTGTEDAIPELIIGLEETDDFRSHNIRRSAAEALGVLGAKASGAVLPLIKALKDESTEVRNAAFRAIISIGNCPDDADTVIAVKALLNDSDPLARLAAASLLYKKPEYNAECLKLLSDLSHSDDYMIANEARNFIARTRVR